jgi:hypothetical protein
MVNSEELIGSSEHMMLDEVSRKPMLTFTVFCVMNSNFVQVIEGNTE